MVGVMGRLRGSGKRGRWKGCRDRGRFGMYGHVYGKLRAAAFFAVDVDVSAVHFCESFCDGQAKSDASFAKFILA